MAEVGNYKAGRIVLPWNSKGYRHKTAAKTKRDRIIYLTPELKTEVEAAIKGRKDGHIFLGPRGKPYSARNMHKQWERIVGKDEVQKHLQEHHLKKEHVTLYAFRHTFISEWVDSGRSVKICADICGTSVAMIERVYGHPDEAKVHEHYLAFMAGQR